jgi:hypothetical protein
MERIIDERQETAPPPDEDDVAQGLFSIVDMASRMRELQAKKDELEGLLKDINKNLDQLRLRDIPDAMADADIRTLTIDGIGRVQLASDAYVSIIDKEAGYAWLAEHGYDGLIQPYVQPSTLKAAVKAAIKEGQTFPDELFNIQPFMRASIVKS